ncbi:potassium transporter [Corchorus olitorius]|uniref:Potassium transporter n=1 Tax=Corchorus olitorius TaxID=93759 RepID=A0A1R3GYH9_9ROSI|nr:potassium transporter [Corchorus olitorius]
MQTILLSFQSLGVVYGRLSTAPLYVFGSIPPKDFKSEESVYEYLSFIFWTLTIVSLVKYAFIVLRANDDGEGGTFALYSLLCRHAKVGLIPDDKTADDVMHYEARSSNRTKIESRARRAIAKHKSSHYLMLFLALFGACMIIGDAVLTPAISVLSASRGLQRSLSDIKFSSSERTDESIYRDFKKYVPLPSACAILVCLFTLQHYGSHRIGFIFAPIVILWLLLIGGVGIYNIIHCDSQILSAISPTYMYKFVKNISLESWRALSSVILCVAGSEAMFADLGHFSKKPIKMTFVSLIFPVLILCYAGQAAFISHALSPKNLGDVPEDYNHLYKSIPDSMAIPDHVHHLFTVLSLLASAIGSQATITACFSIINQCLALGCFPRVKVIHTSNKIHGQVYIPDVNWILMVLSLGVTIGFHDTKRIGNAAGMAIISGMLVTTCLMSLVIALYWERSLLVSACFLIFFGSIEAMYLSSSILNIHKGAWYLVVLVVLSMTVMVAWHYGTKKKYEFDLENKVSTEWLTNLSLGLGVSRVPGIGFIYTDIVTGIPAFFSHFITNLPAFHQVLIFVSFKSLPVPYVSPSRRYLIGRVGPREYKIYRCIVRYGYCDHTRDTDDFEEQIISSIGEFISLEEHDSESLTSPEGRMIVIGRQSPEGHALIPLHDTSLNAEGSSSSNAVTEWNPPSPMDDASGKGKKMKKVRFMLPDNSKMRMSVREELKELVEARESGTAYFLESPMLH